MRKLKLTELGRKSIPEYQAADKTPVVVILDNIRSKINVGSVFRNSDAYLIEKIYLCGYTPCPPDREITKSAIGAELSVDWEHRQEIVPLIEELKAAGTTLLSIEQCDDSTSLKDYHLQPGHSYALVFGNEVEGVSQAVVDRSDAALEIPMFGTKHSFNIGVSCGIVLYGLLGAK